jgi:signal transduction histidine kinase
MRRIRIVFVLVSLALVACMGPLIKRALDAVELERAAQHEIVSSRIFDEMERALSALVGREEERPFGHYRFYYAPSATVGGEVALTRSPLAALPDVPYVVGYFQIDPDGSLHTPHRPRDEALARQTGDWRPAPEVLRELAALDALVRRHAGVLVAPVAVRDAFAAPPQAPGTTLALKRPGEARERRADAAPVVGAESKGPLYDAVTSLNRGLAERVERQAKIEEREAEAAAEHWQRALPALRKEAPAADARRAPLPSAARRVRPAPEGAERFRALGYAEFGIAAAEADDAPAPAASARVQVTYEPFAARSLDDAQLALVRSVRIAGFTTRQGLVIDLRELAAHLRGIGLGSDGLARYAELAFIGPGLGEPSPVSADAYLYQRRFAEPFDDLGGRLALTPLPGAGGAASVYLLTSLLVGVGSIGLFALYRMVAVVVNFAERRGNFVAAVSHELKTPLTAIRMYAEMLRDGMVPEPKRRQYYRTITAESERLSRLINNVLEFSRLEKDSRDVKLRVGPVGPCVLEAAETLRPHAEREGFRIEVEIEDDLPPARFDRDALLQVLFNLIDNALKYAASARDRVVRVECTRDADRVRLRVRDRGPGVAPRHLDKVFEPFYRGEDELTRTSKGTGLGLALVKGLVERMGGAIAGGNAAGGGFEVTIALPLAPAG